MRETQTSKNLFISIAIAVVLLLGAGGLVLNNKLNDKPKQSASTAQTPKQTAPKTKTVTYDGVEGKTALALLKENATVLTKDSSYGPYVESINGVSGGTDGKYWAFYVNGQMAQVGADAYATKAGDKIEWKLQ